MNKYLYTLLCAFTLLFISCGDDNGITYADGNNGSNSGGNQGTVTPSKVITERMETPEVLNNGSTQLISHSTKVNGRDVMTYELEYDLTKCHSRWVAFRFDGDTRAKGTGRTDVFADDPDLAPQYQIGSRGFGMDYNRGHLCASADRLYSEAANVQTFYMTNMSPQLGSFNQGYWVTLEGLVQKCGRDASFSDTLYVVKGGTINQPIDYVNRSNGLSVVVPKYYYMALLKVKNGQYSSIAFWMEHKEYGYDYQHNAPLSEIRKTAVSVNTLESYTAGINFFPNLPDNIEETVENQCIPGNWKM